MRRKTHAKENPRGREPMRRKTHAPENPRTGDGGQAAREGKPRPRVAYRNRHDSATIRHPPTIREDGHTLCRAPGPLGLEISE